MGGFQTESGIERWQTGKQAPWMLDVGCWLVDCCCAEEGEGEGDGELEVGARPKLANQIWVEVVQLGL